MPKNVRDFMKIVKIAKRYWEFRLSDPRKLAFGGWGSTSRHRVVIPSIAIAFKFPHFWLRRILCYRHLHNIQ